MNPWLQGGGTGGAEKAGSTVALPGAAGRTGEIAVGAGVGWTVAAGAGPGIGCSRPGGGWGGKLSGVWVPGVEPGNKNRVEFGAGRKIELPVGSMRGKRKRAQPLNSIGINNTARQPNKLIGVSRVRIRVLSFITVRS